jgi:hypothetical protein
MLVFAGGWVALMVVFVLTQQLFYEASRKTHGLWRPWYDRWADPRRDEMSRMFQATFVRHPDRGAERARRRYLIVILLMLVYMVLGLPFGILIERILWR